MSKPGPKPFYQEGIRFECQGSGKCCTSRGSYGYVYLTLEDRKRFADYFGLSTAQFTRQYCNTKDGHVFLKDPPEASGDCIFLEDGNRCGTYEARPGQCRTWPFWPENMKAKIWRREIASFCPGVGKGRLHTREEIEEILKQSNPEG